MLYILHLLGYCYFVFCLKKKKCKSLFCKKKLIEDFKNSLLLVVECDLDNEVSMTDHVFDTNTFVRLNYNTVFNSDIDRQPQRKLVKRVTSLQDLVATRNFLLQLFLVSNAGDLGGQFAS